MWQRRDELAVKEAVAYALRGVKMASLKRRLSEDERRYLADAVVRHFALCQWEVWHDRPPDHSIP